MEDPAILFVKPKAIKAGDKTALRRAGVIVIEVANPADMRFVRAHAELTGSEMLTAAMKAISENQYSYAAKTKFAEMIIEAFLAKTHQDVLKGDED